MGVVGWQNSKFEFYNRIIIYVYVSNKLGYKGNYLDIKILKLYN